MYSVHVAVADPKGERAQALLARKAYSFYMCIYANDNIMGVCSARLILGSGMYGPPFWPILLSTCRSANAYIARSEALLDKFDRKQECPSHTFFWKACMYTVHVLGMHTCTTYIVALLFRTTKWPLRRFHKRDPTGHCAWLLRTASCLHLRTTACQHIHIPVPVPLPCREPCHLRRLLLLQDSGRTREQRYPFVCGSCLISVLASSQRKGGGCQGMVLPNYYAAYSSWKVW